MKNIIKNNFKIFISIIITVIISVSGTAFATYNYIAKDVSYTPVDNTFNVDNVEDALNELFLNVNSTIETKNNEIQTKNNEISELQMSLDNLRENSQCVKGTIENPTDCGTNTGCVTDVYFEPSLFYIWHLSTHGEILFYNSNYDVDNLYFFHSDTTLSVSLMADFFKFDNGNWIFHNFNSYYITGTLEYVACK